ncbi:MAG: hypothetical protein WA821_11990 [Anaerolineales bacterium]
MDAILNKKRQITFAAILLALVAGISVMNFTAVSATGYSGWFTGYAMGASKGAAMVTLVQGHFANHLNTACPNDPAAAWQWGTGITTTNWIGMKDYSGAGYYLNKFKLEDVGDLNCSQGNYWVDLYFGRYTLSASVCSCPGVTGSVCTVANTNSCTQATNFGRTTKTYTQP